MIKLCLLSVRDVAKPEKKIIIAVVPTLKQNSPSVHTLNLSEYICT